MNRKALRALACATVLLALLPATINGASAAHSRVHLVILRTGKPDPSWQTWVAGKRSRVVHTYDDTNDVWSVFIRYKGCPVTPRGAIRVTVYQNQYKWNPVGQGEWVADYSKPAVRYSRTAIDHRPSDNVLYTWPAHKRSSWEVHLQVPSPRGCSWWKYGGETN